MSDEEQGPSGRVLAGGAVSETTGVFAETYKMYDERLAAFSDRWKDVVVLGARPEDCRLRSVEAFGRAWRLSLAGEMVEVPPEGFAEVVSAPDEMGMRSVSYRVPWTDASLAVVAAPLAPERLDHWFAGCWNLREVRGLGLLDTSCARSMRGTFLGCEALAELVSEDGAALLDNLESLCSRIEMSMQQRLEKADQRLQNLLDKPVMRRPQLVVEQARSNLESYAVLLERLMREKLQQNQRELQLQTARLQALNPLARLAGGYSVTTHDGSVVSSVGQLTAGDLVDIRLSDGVVHAQVTSVSSLKGVKKNGRKIDI